MRGLGLGLGLNRLSGGGPSETFIDTQTGFVAFNAAPWNGSGAVLTSAGVPGPDGGGDATTFTTPGGNFQGFFRAGGAGVRRAVFRVKANTTTRVWIRMDNAGVKGTWFDLSAGTVGTDQIGGGAIASLGSGWYRIEAQGTNDNTALGLWAATGDASILAPAGNFLLFDAALYSVP